MKFGLFMKYAGLNKDGMVFSTYKTSLEEAREYFRGLKKLSKEEFNKLFMVAEIRN